jgi:diguanylate cyclase (GGDEF)-like protein
VALSHSNYRSIIRALAILGANQDDCVMLSRLKKPDLFAAAAGLSVLALALLVGALFYVAERADRAAKLHEEAVVANGLNVRLTEIAERAAHMLENQSSGQSHPHDFEYAYLVDDDGRVLRALADGEAIAHDHYGAFRDTQMQLIAPLRQIEASPNPFIDAPAAPLQASAVAHIEGAIFVVTATLDASVSGEPAIITAERVDDEFLNVLVDRFLLDNLQLTLGESLGQGRAAEVALTDATGANIATLTWSPRRPGAELLRNALPFVLILIAALGALGWGVFQRGRKAARNLIASEARATHLAYHDALTGLPNRLLLADRLGRAVEDLRRRKTPFAVHCIDLDRFKEVNDTFGHAAGDELIRLAAEQISAACRTSDTVARLGGDEFAIVQIGATLEGAARLAERIVAALSEPIDLSVGRVHIGASIGLTLLTDAPPDPQECLRQADLALYRVKENGRGNYCLFEQEMDATVRFRRALQTDLHEAIANQALEMAYQPQVDGAGRIVGLEALVRWHHNERGSLSPAVFVPIAEECGLIDALGFFTLRRAFEDSRRWPGLKVAINISATQLRMKDFAARLGALVAEIGVDPAHFELEITEGVLLGDDPHTHQTLRQIRDLGFGLALDDFGTGYSSLSYLQRYPVDKIKIDRSFVTNLGVDNEADAVVAAIVRLARALHLSVIAEGVETDEQRACLARAGCSQVQGYLFGRPSPAATIDALVAAQNPSRHAPAAQVA